MVAKPSKKQISTYAFTVLTGALLLAGIVQAREERVPPGSFQVAADEGRYTLSANGANLYDVLESLRQASGLDFLIDEKLREETVTAHFERVEMEALLEQLAESRALVYERDGDGVKLVGAVVTSQQEAPEQAEPETAAPLRHKAASQLSGPPQQYGFLSNTTRSLTELKSRGGPSAIFMANGVIDTSFPDAADRTLAIPEPFRARKDTEYFIVQFDDKITPAERTQIEDLGGRIVHYVPRNALAVQARPEVQAVLAQADNVLHVEPFHPYFKMSPDLVDFFGGGTNPLSRERVEKGRFNVLTFQGVRGEDLLASQSGVAVVTVFKGLRVRVRCKLKTRVRRSCIFRAQRPSFARLYSLKKSGKAPKRSA